MLIKYIYLIDIHSTLYMPKRSTKAGGVSGRVFHVGVLAKIELGK